MEKDGYLFIGNRYVLRVDKHSLNKQFEVELFLNTDAIIVKVDFLKSSIEKAKAKPSYIV